MPPLDASSREPSRIVLLGFMGAGKTTVGTLLARRLGWIFYDGDAVLEKNTGLRISDLFTRHGEQGFRALEMETVATLMQLEHAVIALGGGALESPSTRSLLGSSADTCTVFLDAPLKIMLDRCQLSPGTRPLLEDRDAVPERYQRRLPHYRSAAITVNTGGLTPQAVVQVLIQKLYEIPRKLSAEEPSKGRTL